MRIQSMNTTPDNAHAWTLDNLVWQDIGTDGTKYTLLEGRRDTAGEAFTYAISLKLRITESCQGSI